MKKLESLATATTYEERAALHRLPLTGPAFSTACAAAHARSNHSNTVYRSNTWTALKERGRPRACVPGSDDAQRSWAALRVPSIEPNQSTNAYTLASSKARFHMIARLRVPRGQQQRIWTILGW